MELLELDEGVRMNLYSIAILLVSFISGWLFYDLRKANKTIKFQRELLTSKQQESINYERKWKEERAKHEFGTDDTLAKFLYRVIVQKQKIQIHEIDVSFKTMPSLTILHRVFIKNVLVQLNWMEFGEIIPDHIIKDKLRNG